jgi:uncharacterized lipoprotein YbaY
MMRDARMKRLLSVLAIVAGLLAVSAPRAVAQSAVISTVNSTTAALGNAAVFTGTAEDVSLRDAVTVLVVADQASATNGLSLEFSSDGTNWDHKYQYTVAANVGASYVLPVEAKFFRAVYTNGATPQGAFRLQTISRIGSLTLTVQNVGDPCQNPNVTKLSAVVNIASATTAAIVSNVTGKAVYVCDYGVTLAGTSPTAQFKYGTQTTTACDTGAVLLTGVMAPTAGSFVSPGHGGDHFHTAVSQQLCATVTGTGPSVQGWLTYVQQ